MKLGCFNYTHTQIISITNLFVKRNVLIESARIARGNIKPLDELEASNFDALIIPGGFGIAKNLSDFATRDINMNVDKEVERVMREFECGKKPIGYRYHY